MSPSEVLIVKGINRYTVKTRKLNEEILAIVRCMKRRMWDRENLEWSLPMESYDDFLYKLEDKGYEYKVMDRKPWALCEIENDNYVIKISEYVTNLDFLPLKGRWDRERYRFIVPVEKKLEIEKLFEEHNVECIFIHSQTLKRSLSSS